MLKLKNFLPYHLMLLVTVSLGLTLTACGSGGGAENILCGGETCPTGDTVDDNTDDDTDDIGGIVGQGTPDAIEFVSVSPSIISIRGAGGDETSVVTFLVTDTAGDPIEDVLVTFTLASGDAGGVTLSNPNDRTNVDGEASVIVQAGASQTSATVSATISSLNVFTNSSAITVSTGIATDDRFTLSFDTVNPEALEYNLVEVIVTASLADFYGNPPPDGTSVTFYAESGLINPGVCSTLGGQCSVLWLSGDPDPGEGAASVGEVNGLAQILAYTDGAESFIDTNDNGVFDAGETFGDLDDLYADELENGEYDFGEKLARENATYLMPDGLYSGPLCNSGCASSSTIKIGRSGTLVVSGSVATLVESDPATYPSDPVQSFPTVGTTVDVSTVPVVFTNVFIGDINGNSMPAGTEISVSVTNGEVEGDTFVEVPDSTRRPVALSFTVSEDNLTENTGELRVRVETPRERVTNFVWTIVDDD
ncbi:hypothetical protein JYU12_01565 [bacterium AH-315-K03]|nr:hypothetical protein [bacterium AH-315-K03]